MSDTQSPTPMTDEAYVDSVASGEGRKVSAKRKHKAEFPVSEILVVPEENYRWGSRAGMEADLAKIEYAGDGVQVNSFEKLCENIKLMGVQTPVGLVQREDGRYHIIYGFTRCVAVQRLGLETIPAYVYDSTITDSEVQLLQLMENAEDLHRSVNWVQELEQIDDLIARFAQREVGKDKAPESAAVAQVAKLIGKSAGTIRNRRSWMKAMHPEVIKLGRRGIIGHVAALLLTSDSSSVCTKRFPPEFVEKVLVRLKNKNPDYPKTITPQEVRDAIRAIRIKNTADASADGEKEEREITPPKTRQSPAMLRDISVMLARVLLRKAGLSISSPAKDVQKIVGCDVWCEIRGYGVGAGDALVPPVLEAVLGRRNAEKDDYVQRLTKQYERSGNAYATRCFVEALIHDVMENAGVHCIGDSEHSGWKAQYTMHEGKKVDNQRKYREAMDVAVAMPEDTKLLDRAKAAWEILKPVVLSYRKQR